LFALWMALALAGGTPFSEGLTVERGAMGALASWSVGNMLVGVPAARQTEDRSRAFWLANVGWNGVNLGIAGMGAISMGARARKGDPGLEQVTLQHRKLRRALAINAGLDLGYVVTGLVLQRTAERRELRGLGDALVLQGAFLLTFDAGFLLEHRRRTRRP
jgi:hypothetical protein